MRRSYTIPAVERYFDRLVERKLSKPLSAAASELSKLAREMSFVEDEIRAFGAPSECAVDAYRGIRRRAEEVARKYGFINLSLLLEVIARRTSERWVFFSGLSMLQEEVRC